MKLYFFPVAPNPTKVRLYLAEKAAAGCEVPMEFEQVNLREGEQRRPEHLARNPVGRLPVLELDDGSFLTESLAIIEYLEEQYPKPPLIGSTAMERARNRELERLAEFGGLFALAIRVHATNSPLGFPPRPEAAEFARIYGESILPTLEERVSDGRAFLAGERPTIADCTLAAGLQFGRFFQIDAIAGYPHLQRWDEAYRKRPAVQSVLVA